VRSVRGTADVRRLVVAVPGAGLLDAVAALDMPVHEGDDVGLRLDRSRTAVLPERGDHPHKTGARTSATGSHSSP
jgi:hypothetical protein